MKDQAGDGVKQLDEVGKSTGRLITVQLNVTSEDQVAAAVETVRTKLPSSIKVRSKFVKLCLCDVNERFFWIQGLWAVVNNAGFSTFGEMEWVPLSVYETVSYFLVSRDVNPKTI